MPKAEIEQSIISGITRLIALALRSKALESVHTGCNPDASDEMIEAQTQRITVLRDIRTTLENLFAGDL